MGANESNSPGARTREFFDAIAPRYDRSYAKSGSEARQSLGRLVDSLRKKRVLVLGVGTGRELPPLLDGGYEPTGLDVSPAMLDLCRTRRRQIPLVLGDFYDPLPFGTGSFDSAIALHGSLAHPPSREALLGLLGELARILAPQGTFIAEVPSPDWILRSNEGLLAEGAVTGERNQPQALEEDDLRAPHLVPLRGPGASSVFSDPVTLRSIDIQAFSPTDWVAWLSADFEATCAHRDGELTLVGVRRG